MDILKPKLLWIGKRCYRVNSVENANVNDYEQLQPATKEYIEDDLYGEDDTFDMDEYNVTEQGNRYKLAFHVPQAFYGAIIGSKGSVKKRIESETLTEITVPKHGTGDVTILGKKRDSVCLARRRIELILKNCRRKTQPTHFICIKIVDQTIKTNVLKFKDEILKSGPTFGLQDKMFIEAEKLHLTIGCMVLMDDIERARAVELLNECRESILIPIKNEYKKLEISVRGVTIMNDDPSNVRYLYGKIESNTLQKIGDDIIKCFIDAGLAKREFNRDNIKLHMTLINANNGIIDNNDDETNFEKFNLKTFDARHILEKYADFEFGSFEFNKIYLAIMKSKDADGFYKCTASIQF